MDWNVVWSRNMSQRISYWKPSDSDREDRSKQCLPQRSILWEHYQHHSHNEEIHKHHSPAKGIYYISSPVPKPL